MFELRAPNRFVRANAVKENDRHRLAAAAGFIIADRISVAGDDPWHARILAADRPAR